MIVSRLPQVRLAEPIVALSGVGDLVRVRRTGAAARSCFLACRLARAMGLSDETSREVFYTALLQHVGCVGYAHEAAAVFGGRDVEMNLAGSHTDFASPADMFRTFIPELSSGVDMLTRMRILTAALTKAPGLGPVIHRASCEVGVAVAERVGLPIGVGEALRHVEEWYDGKGGYLGRSGDAIPIAARIVLTAFTASVFGDFAGTDAAIQVVAKRGGRQLDPDAAAAFVDVGHELLAELDAISVDTAVLDEEPVPHVRIDGTQLDEVALAFGEAVDLKTMSTLGNARRAYDLAGRVAPALGLDATIVDRLRRAAALRDVGKAAISNAILDKRTPLTAAELDELRLHAYHTERILARAPTLAAEAELAGLHHEHEDGSGYHRGLRGDATPIGAKILAALDTYLAATADDPDATAAIDRACRHLTDLGRSGVLNDDVARAVVQCVTGAGRPLQRAYPAGLSQRQVEVVRLIARGMSNKQIAAQLVVSPRTAEHHVQDIYFKIGRSSRAAVALFAMEHRLL